MGSNSGLSWTDAYTDLQTAIDSSESGDTICVAEGTYYPSAKARGCIDCDSTRDVTFHLRDGVVMIGGYASGGSEREWKTYKTILSGDIGVKADSTDNANHVVIGTDLSESTVFDGFYIRHGVANGSGQFKISNRNFFRFNAGGVYFYYSDHIMKRVVIEQNVSNNTAGGAFLTYCEGLLSDVIIRHNNSFNGGGLSLSNCSMKINDCSVNSNIATNNGGGMLLSFDSSFVSRTSICENYAVENGGGIYASGGDCFWDNCVIAKNVADASGGGFMFLTNSGDFKNLTVVSNQASFTDGGVVNNSVVSITNSIFAYHQDQIDTFL